MICLPYFVFCLPYTKAILSVENKNKLNFVNEI